MGYVDPSGHKVISCAKARDIMQDAIDAKQNIKGLEPSVASELRAWYENKRNHNRLSPNEIDMARRIGC